MSIIIIVSSTRYSFTVDYVSTPTEAPHHHGDLLSGDPLTAENSVYTASEKKINDYKQTITFV